VDELNRVHETLVLRRLVRIVALHETVDEIGIRDRGRIQEDVLAGIVFVFGLNGIGGKLSKGKSLFGKGTSLLRVLGSCSLWLVVLVLVVLLLV
jgi:hypothetical protein